MRTKRALLNTIFSLLLQLVTVICGFILPRMILAAFGSEVNGAVSSIAQFLGYISMLEAGVGGVTRAAMFKPLAENDFRTISGIANATQSFFRKLALAFLVYAGVLACVFKHISASALDGEFLFTLVLILSVSTFAQYYFGITRAILLIADQKSYVANGIQIVTVIVNTLVSVLLLKLGAGIRTIKLVSILIFLARPAFLVWYTQKYYHLDKTVPPNNDAIKQRWDGLGHHIAYFLHNNTDIFVITVFMGLKWVSVYSVYHMIVSGIKSVVASLSGGSEAAFGNMIAKGEKQALEKNFHMVETLGSMVVVIFFSTTGLMLFDFIRLYTARVQDIDYIILPMGILFVITQALYCIREQYHGLILAAGHYKQTRMGAFVEAGINVGLSLIFVQFWNVSGVLVATVIATVYRILNYVWHLKKHILHRNPLVFFMRQAVNIMTVASILVVSNLVPFATIENYAEWVVKAIVVFGISAVITIAWNTLFYREDLKLIIYKLRSLLKRRA